MTTETNTDEVEATVIVEPVVITEDELWGVPDPHANDPDEDKEEDDDG